MERYVTESMLRAVISAIAASATSFLFVTPALATNVYVEFFDSTQVQVSAVFTAPQSNTNAWPYQGTISNTDARYTAFMSLQAQNAVANQLASGAVVTCISATSLSGTYAVSAPAQAALAGAFTSAAAGHVLGGGSTFNYPDTSGTPHAFTAAQFVTVGNALGDYAYKVNAQGAVIAGGGTPTWPSNALSPSC